MNEEDESIFQDLVARLGHEAPGGAPDPAEISLFDLINTTTVLSEASCAISGFVCRFLEDQTLGFPDHLVELVLHIHKKCVELSDGIAEKLFEIDDDDECDHDHEEDDD